MFEWSDEHVMVREAVRRWIDAEVRPNLDALESGDLPPYDLIRKFASAFGLDALGRASFKRHIERERAGTETGERPAPAEAAGGEVDVAELGGSAFSLIPVIEFCRVSPGIVTAM